MLLLTLLVFSACSTMNMERKLAEENRIDTDVYAYDDEEFVFNEGVLQTLANRFRLEELSTENINSIMEDEIKAGYYNEVIIYMRYLLDNEEDQAAMYMDRYYEALFAHVQNTEDPSPQLIADAIEIAERQFTLKPDDQKAVVQYANLLIDSRTDVDEGLRLLFQLEENLEEVGEDPTQQTLLALANAHFIDGNYGKSVDLYLLLASLNPEDALLYYNLSYVLQTMGDTTRASEYLDQAYSPTMDFLDTYGTNSYGAFESFLRSSNPTNEADSLR